MVAVSCKKMPEQDVTAGVKTVSHSKMSRHVSRQEVSDSQQEFNAGSRSRKSQQGVSSHSSQSFARRCYNRMPRKDVRARCVKSVPQQEVTAGCLSKLPRQDVTGRFHGKMLAQDATARCHGSMSQQEVTAGCHSKT